MCPGLSVPRFRCRFRPIWMGLSRMFLRFWVLSLLTQLGLSGSYTPSTSWRLFLPFSPLRTTSALFIIFLWITFLPLILIHSFSILLKKESSFPPDLSSSNFKQIRTFFINPPASVFTFWRFGFMVWVGFFLVRFEFINANFLLELEWD